MTTLALSTPAGHAMATVVLGIALGNLPLTGFTALDFFRGQHVLEMLAELGFILLLFEVLVTPPLLRWRIGSGPAAAPATEGGGTP